MQKFVDVLSRWEAGCLSMLEAGELLGVSERQFRRYRDRYEDDGLEGLRDGRLGKPSGKRVPAGEKDRVLRLYREAYRGWNVKHFHEHLRRDHGFRWGYTWVKAQLHGSGLVVRAPRRGVHRRKRERKPCEGMMLHQDGSRAAWLAGQPALDLIVTMDDATSTIYSAFLVEEEGTASTFRGLLEVFVEHGLPSSLYTDRGSHYFYTPQAGEAVDRQRPTQVGRALDRLGIEHIAAYSPQARGRSERMFGTLQDRLIKELAKAGQSEVEAANRWIRQVYLPRHNARFARLATLADSGFVRVADPGSLAETLCIEEERVVDRANTVSFGRLKLQLPPSPLRAHYVKARVRVRQYCDGGLAVFHGPRCVARFDDEGRHRPDAPTCASATSCSPRSRTLRAACGGGLRPSLTAAARDVSEQRQVGTKKRPPGRTKKLTLPRSRQLQTTAP
jgi:transposase